MQLSGASVLDDTFVEQAGLSARGVIMGCLAMQLGKRACGLRCSVLYYKNILPWGSGVEFSPSLNPSLECLVDNAMY